MFGRPLAPCEITAPPYECPTITAAGPARPIALRASAASASSPSNGSSTAMVGTCRAASPVTTLSQHHAPCHAPCTRTTVCVIAASYLLTDIQWRVEIDQTHIRPVDVE